MAAVWLYARTDLRRRWRSVAVVVVILGLAGAFALAALVGARRSDTAWDRFRTETRAPDAFVSIPSRNDPAATDEIRELPGVIAAGGFVYVSVAPPGVPEGGAFAALDEQVGSTVSRPRIVRGRRAPPGAVDEVTVNTAMAEATGVEPGGTLRLEGQGTSRFSTDVKVVGVHLGTIDVSVNATFPSVLLTPAFLAEHRSQMDVGRQNQFVRLRGGDEGVAPFRRAATAHFGDDGGLLIGGAADEESGIIEALDLQATSLALVAAAAVVATLVAVGQALGRYGGEAAADLEVLSALGLTRRQRRLAVAPAVATVTVSGTALAVLLAAAASPHVLTGLARQVDPHAALRSDAVVLGAGGLLLATAVGLAGAGAAVRAGRRKGPVPPRSPSWLAGVFAPLGPAATVGIRNALGGGPARVRAASRSARIAAVASLFALAAASTFAVSLDHLVGTPRLYGWDFDVILGAGGEDSEEVDAAAAALVEDPDVDRLAIVEVDFLSVGDETVETHVLEQRKGLAIHPTLAAGRAPVGPGEIALGSRTMKRLGVTIGDRVPAATPDGVRNLAVVGQGIYPTLGDGTMTDAASLAAEAAAGLRLEESRGRLIALSLVPGRDPHTVVTRHTDLFLSAPLPPSDITNLEQVGSAPWVVAAFFALLGLSAVGHALAVSVRAGRGSFAIVRALGFTGRQVRAAVAWHASAIVVIGIVGVPLGLVAGRWAWISVVSGTGALAEDVIPGALVLLGVAVMLVVCNGAAALPGQLASRMRPSEVLRAE